MTLQEAVAASGEANRTCFVAYFDVVKAFDSIWINGLFYQLYHLGISGRIWRIIKLVYSIQMVYHELWDPSGGIFIFAEICSIYKFPPDESQEFKPMCYG